MQTSELREVIGRLESVAAVLRYLDALEPPLRAIGPMDSDTQEAERDLAAIVKAAQCESRMTIGRDELTISIKVTA